MTPRERLILAALLHDLPKLIADRQRLPEMIQTLAAQTDKTLQDAERLALGGDLPPEQWSEEPLMSIFSRVGLDESRPPQPAYQPVLPLPRTGAEAATFARLFPQPDKPSDEEAAAQRATQIDELIEALTRLDTEVGWDDFEQVYSHLLVILQQYTWCLAAHRPDVSFFDHARLTAAIVAVRQSPQATADRPFCLVVGDLSGIQEYIFDITNIGVGGGVARRLRARSFYLSVVADVISHQLAHTFEMPLGNVIRVQFL